MISFPATFAIVSMAAVLTLNAVVGSPVKYDQRQEGDLNVRTDVEDVVFVVVPPKDLITAGMGLVAASAADLLRKNYGGIGPERWPQRTSSKLGFVPLEKSPYKIDLERSEVQVKKISQAGDPNRYNIHETKPPVKLVQEVVKSSTEAPVKQTTEGAMLEKVDEMQSTTEGKTVKKDLKSGAEEEKEEKKKMEVMKDETKMEKTDAKLEKKTKPEPEMKKPDATLEKKTKPDMEMKKPDATLEKKTKPEMEMQKPDTTLEKKSKPESETKKTEESGPQETLKVQSEGMKGQA